MSKYYAGIGSRETPNHILSDMGKLALELSKRGYVLRSGGADGADSAFEGYHKGPMEIYLPWNGFNGKWADNKNYFVMKNEEAEEIAAQFHPVWDRLNRTARLLHTRNVHQILGQDLKTPVDFVVCWTKDGKASGGTGQALRIAESLKIPVYNLKNINIENILKILE